MSDKILIVYYSLTGNTKLIAEAIQEELGAEVLALKPIKELNPKGAMKFVWGGMQSTMKKKPKLKEITIDPLEFDLIFLGTPIWAWSFSPPIRTFHSMFDVSGKDVAIWTCSAGDPASTLRKYKEYLKKANIIGKTSFIEPLKKNPEEAKEKAREWAKEIVAIRQESN